MNQLTPEKLKEYQLLRDEKINKIKSSTNPDYIRSVFNGSKDCEAIISYQNTQIFGVGLRGAGGGGNSIRMDNFCLMN